MSKRRGDSFDPATQARLLAVGRYEAVTDPGYCELHFGTVPALVADLATFDLSWFVSSPGKAVPTPDEGLFALWERYRAAHRAACAAYQQQLFALFAQSPQAGYDDRQWRLLRRTRPTADDLRSVVTHATVSLHQTGPPRAYEVQVAFNVFWDEHGVALRLRETVGGFAVAEWSGIGDL